MGTQRASEQEFKDGVLKIVSYEGLKMIADNDKQIMFKTIEKIMANDGTGRSHGVEILLGLEDDDVWRVTQERVLTDDESRHDGLLPAVVDIGLLKKDPKSDPLKWANWVLV